MAFRKKCRPPFSYKICFYTKRRSAFFVLKKNAVLLLITKLTTKVVTTYYQGFCMCNHNFFLLMPNKKEILTLRTMQGHRKQFSQGVAKGSHVVISNALNI